MSKTIVLMAIIASLFLCIIVLYYYSYTYLYDKEAWKSINISVPGAVLSALIVGLTVSGSSIYIQRSQQERDDQNSQKSEKNKNKERILSIILYDLNSMSENMNLKIHDNPNINDANLMIKSRENIRTNLLSNGFWQSISNSGETKWIDNSDMLYEIAKAYDYIQMAVESEKRLIDVNNSIGFSMTVKLTNGVEIPLWYVTLENAISSYGKAIPQIVKAIHVISDGVDKESSYKANARK